MLKVLNFKKEPELIFYERNDENGPKLSDFTQVKLGNKSEGIKVKIIKIFKKI